MPKVKPIQLYLALGLMLLSAFSLSADITSNAIPATEVDHQPWQLLLDSYLKEDTQSNTMLFNFAGVTTNSTAQLQGYLKYLANLEPENLGRAEQYAYWVNLYNALTVSIVLANYPVASIKDIDAGFLDFGPWDETRLTISGKPVSLDTIEHEILRPLWNDPRTHYALNCASLGCPQLNAKAFTAANTEELLNSSASRFINNSRGLYFEGEDLVLSSIYDWFKEDFGSNERELINHLRQFASPTLNSKLEAFDGVIRYQYNWALNDSNGKP